MAWLYGLASLSLTLLHAGGTVVVVRRGRPEFVLEAMLRTGATFLAGVTATFAKLLQHLEEHDPTALDGSPLRLCISGGEPRNEPVFSRWSELTGVGVLDAYCASECLPLITYDPTTDPMPRIGSAGKVVPRSRIRIIDPDGREVSPGQVGELLGSGPGVMLGYWREPELTAEALVDGGWYRMKDLVRMDEEGYVYVVGRLSDLIIRGGVNISPAEVESVLRGHEHVLDIAVVGVPDEVYGERVVAAVVPDGDLDVDHLRAFAKEQLSSFKVPSEFVIVDSLPVNATTGKTSRRDVAAMIARTTQNR